MHDSKSSSKGASCFSGGRDPYTLSSAIRVCGGGGRGGEVGSTSEKQRSFTPNGILRSTLRITFLLLGDSLPGFPSPDTFESASCASSLDLYDIIAFTRELWRLLFDSRKTKSETADSKFRNWEVRVNHLDLKFECVTLIVVECVAAVGERLRVFFSPEDKRKRLSIFSRKWTMLEFGMHERTDLVWLRMRQYTSRRFLLRTPNDNSFSHSFIIVNTAESVPFPEILCRFSIQIVCRMASKRPVLGNPYSK